MSDRSAQPSETEWFKVTALDCLRISGPDAESFLQGQLTCDMNLLSPGTALPCAWCSPSGRVLFSGWVIGHQEAWLLLLPAGRADACAAALARYVMRARVVLEAGGDASPALCWRPQARTVSGRGERQGERNHTEFLLPGRPARRIRIADTADATASHSAAFQLAGIRAGVCELPATLEDRFLPQMLNLDLVGGVSFSKGCFPGQEVIARTHHLGRVKRRLLRFRTARCDCLPGTDVVDGTDTVGKVVVFAGEEGFAELLAVINLQAAGASLTLDLPSRPALCPEPLPYAFPGSADR